MTQCGHFRAIPNWENGDMEHIFLGGVSASNIVASTSVTQGECFPIIVVSIPLRNPWKSDLIIGKNYFREVKNQLNYSSRGKN